VKKLRDEELPKLNSWPDIARMTISRGMRWKGHSVRMGAKKSSYKVLAEDTKERDH
jgi:hypothetical protein